MDKRQINSKKGIQILLDINILIFMYMEAFIENKSGSKEAVNLQELRCHFDKGKYIVEN